jgi:hypothetical protein
LVAANGILPGRNSILIVAVTIRGAEKSMRHGSFVDRYNFNQI